MRGSIWLLGYMPPKVKNYQNMLKPLVDMYAKYAPGNQHIDVHDSHLGTSVKKWVICAFLTNDVRGVPNATCGKSPPCLVGTCNMCNVGGHYHRATTVVPGAVWSLNAVQTGARELVNEYKREFKDVYPGGAPTTECGELCAPGKRTKTDALEAGNRVLTRQ